MGYLEVEVGVGSEERLELGVELGFLDELLLFGSPEAIELDPGESVDYELDLNVPLGDAADQGCEGE